MMFRALLAIIILAFTPRSLAAGPTNYWFQGMLNPPAIIPALPTNFLAAVASPPEMKKDFDINEGIVWVARGSTMDFEYSADRQFAHSRIPLFYILLSKTVLQIVGTDKFNNEVNMEASLTRAGMKQVKTARTKWGSYPVLLLTGERPDGSNINIAWVGLNTPRGETLAIDYQHGHGAGHPTKEERAIWDTFVKQTKSRK
ncbi:MAG: hypothetical protein JWN25_2032 [Verrucomicrobiales bacterium]|nr:hypothetical protein [Verrucomicrobiales bacterium]